MRRRDFITLLGGAAAVWPLAARAQQRAKMTTIGYLQTGSLSASADQVAAFRRGLSEAGYVEGRNVAIEYRFADGEYDRLDSLAAELVRLQVALIVAVGGGRPTRAAMAATSTIPIVFTSGDTDPVEEGFVASLNRPGGNVTGVSSMLGALTAKRIGLLHELLPKATTIAMLVNPDTLSVASQTAEAQKAAQTVGLALHVIPASSERDFDTAFQTIAQRRIGALVVSADAFYGNSRAPLLRLAERNALPAVYYRREFVDEGGLMSYATPLPEMYRLTGIYAGRVLGGAKPASLPVLQPTQFELVINLKTAKALGLTVPPNLLAIADEVIE
jgi:putative ABC transport system substrate-binding protein